MPRQALFPNVQNKPVGFSPATKVENMVFVSGQVAVDPSGNLVGEGDAGAQAEQCFKNLEAALSAAGATMADVTKITTFLVSRDDYQAFAEVRHRLFPANGPASSTVIVQGLVSPRYLVEIEAIAVV